jgi:hypothetical protein
VGSAWELTKIFLWAALFCFASRSGRPPRWNFFAAYQIGVLKGQATPERGTMDHANEYRAKAFELLSMAESVNVPERRADMLRYAQMWMNLSKPMPDLPSAYELKRASH